MPAKSTEPCTTAEVAWILNISQQRVRQLVKAGDLTAINVNGKLLLFDREQVETFAKRKRPAGYRKQR